MKNHKAVIGQIDISPAISNFSYTQKLNDMTVGTIILKQKELIELPPLNYAAEVRLSKTTGSADKIIFRGNVTSAAVKTGEIHLKVAAGIDLFHETLIQGMAVANTSGLEQIWSMMRGAGLGEERINIEGFSKGPKEPFEVVVPLTGLTLTHGISFSEFELTKDARILSVAQTIIKEEGAEILTEFASADVWLRLIVQASTLYDAEVEGLRKIDLFLSRLMSRVQLSVSRIGPHHSEWDRKGLLNRLTRADVVLVRGLTTRRRWLRRPFAGSTSILNINELSDIDFPPLTYELPTYLNEAFLAWRRSIHANHPLAAITALWDAIEFYSSQIKVVDDFTKAETRQIRRDAVQSIDPNDEARKNRVANVLNLLNQASLIQKFNLAMNEDGVNLADEETQILQKLRKTRNDFVHGKNVVIPTDAEMLLARTVVNRILVARVLRLSQQTRSVEPSPIFTKN